jgi:prepilin-type N-terminal cleavage/methylation domain-containing protein/prepilin-type processing-associated H-X9-DG protein
MTRLQKQDGFTLIELLVTIAIIACLAGLLQPALVTAQSKARCAACAGNLRQIGMATLQYAGDHDQVLPAIEPWPSQPVYPSSYGAGTILDVLGPYGVTQQLLRCPSDTAGTNFFSREGSSYQWFPGANNIHLVSLGSDGATFFATSPATLFLAFDYSEVHNQLANVLFADGHVAGAVAN